MTEKLNIQEILQFAQTLADESGKIIRKYFRALDQITTKTDKSLVTIADLEVENRLRELIKSQYPFHGIIGEEQKTHNGNANYKWVLDPIDGTLSFVCGRATFGTLIGFVDGDKPIIGIIDQPILNERWAGIVGGQALFNNKICKTRNCKKLDEAIIGTSGPYYFNQDELTKFNNVTKFNKNTIFGGDCYLYALLASGYIDIVIETNLKPHDFCAITAVTKAAGAIVTDWNGNDITLKSNGQIIVCANKDLHKQVIEALYLL